MAQFAAAYYVGTSHLLANDNQLPVPPIAITVVVPVTGFLAAYFLSARFREFVFAQDVRTLTMMQLWRVIGFTFLTLYSFGILPGLFAWPAGVGDVAVGVAALFAVHGIDRDANYVTTPSFVGFHVIGLLDFVVAFITVGLVAGAYPSLISGGLTSAAMDVWPLNIFPSFGVPIFIILHLTVLLKVREMRRIATGHVNDALRTA